MELIRLISSSCNQTLDARIVLIDIWLYIENCNVLITKMFFFPSTVVGVLCKEAVHEQESVCSWSVKGTWDFPRHPCGPWVGSLFHFWLLFFFSLSIYFYWIPDWRLILYCMFDFLSSYATYVQQGHQIKAGGKKSFCKKFVLYKCSNNFCTGNVVNPLTKQINLSVPHLQRKH